jgi:hypothetical protein
MANKDQFKETDQFPNSNKRTSTNDKDSSKLESLDNAYSLKKEFNFWNWSSLNNVMLKKESTVKETQKISPDFLFKNGKKTTKASSNYPSSTNKTPKGDIVSVTYEEIGLWPRSFSRVLDRFLKQVFSDVETLVIQEYRFYRYLFLTTVRCLAILFFVPFLVNFFLKNYLIHPLTEYFWNTKQSEIFLNSYQQKHAFAELKEFEEKLYFESFITTSHTSFGLSKKIIEYPSINTNDSLGTSMIPKSSTALLESPKDSYFQETKANAAMSTSFDLTINSATIPQRGSLDGLNNGQMPLLNTKLANQNKGENVNFPLMSSKENQFDANQFNQFPSGPSFVKPISSSPEGHFYKQRLQEKTVEIATHYNEESIEAITNFFADLLSFLTLFYLIFQLEIQINITKSFLLEVFFGLEDSKKSLLILLITDLLVGYHSSNIWELFFEFLFHHYGLPESQTGIFLLVATLPVLLDVLFKYLIFRHLNRSSPATVATYHAMIE